VISWNPNNSRESNRINKMPARTVSIAAAGSADFTQLSSLTNLTDINRLLHETIAWERSIEADLDKQLGRRTELERDILQLNAATSEVSWGMCQPSNDSFNTCHSQPAGT
jgi:hypothetical protein